MTTPLEAIPVKTNDGKPASLADYAGKVRLVVNVASKCGLTPQYEGLEALYRKYHAQGFEVLAFPANEFGKQEPGTDDEIKEFCSTKYDVTFPLFAKIVVKGPGQHPLYAALTAAKDITWNFEKFLLNRQGEVVARFAPDVTPSDAQLVSAVEKELAR
jgi:glutathione peroxidase